MTGHDSTAPANRILVIDDERLVARVMKRALRGHQVEIADSVDSALAHLEQDPLFSLLLCDLHLGARSGIDLYKEVGRRWPALIPRFVFIHGGVTHPGDGEFLRSIANEQLFKPVEIPVLRALVRRYLD